MDAGKSGYIRIGTIRQVPLRMHWSFVFGGILVALAFHAKQIEILYIWLGYAALIVFHEIGHASVALVYGLKVYSIELSGFGGSCHTATPATRRAALLFASAGVIVQIILLGIAITTTKVFGKPQTSFGSNIAFVFTTINFLFILINLIPQKSRRDNYGTDGYLIWKLLAQVILRRPYGFPDTSPTLSPKTRLLKLNGFTPPRFKSGIEILNDNTTSMQFVVEVLIKHLSFTPEKAMKTMRTIHTKGGILIPLDSYEKAQEISSAVIVEAKQKGYRFVCRPVSTRFEANQD